MSKSISNLYRAPMSDDDIMAAVKRKDGAGSGLDADTLAGAPAASYPQIEVGSWTPKLYDSETYIKDGPSSTYIKIGPFCVAFLSLPAAILSGINLTTILCIKNLPFNNVVGVAGFARSIGSTGRTSVFQGDTGAFFVRSENANNPHGEIGSTGYLRAVAFGYSTASSDEPMPGPEIMDDMADAAELTGGGVVLCFNLLAISEGRWAA